MPTVSVKLPQIGEGLQDARIVAFLKQPGDRIRRDEPIYQMETDKAVMDVESPYEGVLTAWTVKVDDIVLIGAEVAIMESGEAAAPSEAAPAPTGNVVPLRIPMIGEGLQDARVVGFLKQPGDFVKRDEPIYQMETDKAVMDVESPYEGTLVAWTAKVDDVLLIGAEVGQMQVSGAVTEVPAAHGSPVAAAPVAQAAAPVATTGGRRRDVPPRTRAYAKEKGVSNDALETIPAAGSKLMPEDIDRFLTGAPAPVASSTSTDRYDERPLGGKQRILNSRMQRGSQLVVPGTIMVAVLWEGIERRRARYKSEGGDFQPSSFTMFSYAVAQVVRDFPGLRTSIIGDETYRTYKHADLGIAVSLPGDELVIATVPDSDTLDWPSFAAKMRERIDIARGGQDQANEAVTLSLTNMQSFGLRDAVPVVVPPACATLFLGEVYKGVDQRPGATGFATYANIALTFDHRVINGVGASQFAAAVKARVESVEELIP